MISLTWMLLASLVISVAFLMEFPLSFFSKDWMVSWIPFVLLVLSHTVSFMKVVQLHHLYFFISWKWSNYIIFFNKPIT
jgi:hypothetical protein